MRKLKQRLKEEGSEVVTNCHELRFEAPDGKMGETDCANTEGIFRIIQSIPSPKAEPFKKWLAQVGYERIKRMIDKRLRGIAIRHNLTDEWQERGISNEKDYAILTADKWRRKVLLFEQFATDYFKNKSFISKFPKPRLA